MGNLFYFFYLTDDKDSSLQISRTISEEIKKKSNIDVSIVYMFSSDFVTYKPYSIGIPKSLGNSCIDYQMATFLSFNISEVPYAAIIGVNGDIFVFI